MERLKIGKDDEKIIRILIDAMLHPYGVGFDYVREHPEIDGDKWFFHYTWTSEQASQFKEWFMQFFSENVKPRFPKERLEKEWSCFNLMWGLKIARNEENN